MDNSLYTFWAPLTVVLIFLSPAFFRISQLAKIAYDNRWRSRKVLQKTANKKIIEKGLTYAKTFDGRHLLINIVENPNLSSEKLNEIALINNPEVRHVVLKDARIVPETLEQIAKENDLNYRTWYTLAENEKLEEQLKVFLVLSYPEFAKRKLEGIEPSRYDMFDDYFKDNRSNRGYRI